MKITATALSLNVEDVEASADFAAQHFGFSTTMEADGFIAIAHPDSGLNLTFLRTGLSSFKPASIAGSAGQGMLVAFVVDGLDEHFARIAAAGAEVATAPETEPWGERYCQFRDPNGIVWQLVEWV
jgi:uncharacterized glyoxalase superfamily protein PhnB